MMLSKEQLQDASKCSEIECGNCILETRTITEMECTMECARTALEMYEYCEKVKLFEEENERLKIENKALRELLKKIEYIKDTGRIGGAIYKFCPVCGVSELSGHRDDCNLSNLLNAKC